MNLSFSENNYKLFIKTSVWNSIIEVFKVNNNFDIQEYIVSVQIKGKNIIIKTNNPLINAELINFDNEIKETVNKKIKNLGINNLDFELKYV